MAIGREMRRLRIAFIPRALLFQNVEPSLLGVNWKHFLLTQFTITSFLDTPVQHKSDGKYTKNKQNSVIKIKTL